MLLAINPVVIGSEEVNAVNARDLHAELQVKSHFHDWIARRLGDCFAEEGVDYCILSNANEASVLPVPVNVSGGSSGFQAIDYLITTDLAREFAMLEKTPIGKATRNYFIAAEKEARALATRPIIGCSQESVMSLVDAAVEAERKAAKRLAFEQRITIEEAKDQGLTAQQWEDLRQYMRDISFNADDHDKALNAIDTHFLRRYRDRDIIEYPEVLSYLALVAKRYEEGYVPVYRKGSLVIDERMV
jgi:phage anti-repressor protein